VSEQPSSVTCWLRWRLTHRRSWVWNSRRAAPRLRTDMQATRFNRVHAPPYQVKAAQ